MRALDDRIIYKLNTSVPTQSFAGQISAEERCKQLYEEVGCPIQGLCSHLCMWFVQMSAAYCARPVAIQHCIDETSERVREMKSRRDGGGGEDPAINRALRKEQTKVRSAISFSYVS